MNKEKYKREYLNLCNIFGAEFMEICIGFDRYYKERQKYTQAQMIEIRKSIFNKNLEEYDKNNNTD